MHLLMNETDRPPASLKSFKSEKQALGMSRQMTGKPIDFKYSKVGS